MAATPDHFHETLAALSSVLLNETRLEDALSLVASLGKETIKGASSISVSLQQGNTLTTPVSTDDSARHLDSLQYDSRQGPCVEAATRGARMGFRMTDHDTPRPQLLEGAANLDIHSVISLPLRIRDRPIGALNVYSDRPDGLPAAEVDRAEKFAEAAAILLANAQAFGENETRAVQLKEALATRDVIGQAKGILMEREGISADEAFELLRKASQTGNVKLRDIAERFVALAERSTKAKR